MLKEKLEELFNKNQGVVRCHTLRKNNLITFKVTDDGLGFTCDRGPAVFSFKSMDALEHEMKIVARNNNDKVYYGAKVARSGQRLGDNPWFENTIDGIIARRCFGKQDGDSVNATSSFIAGLLQKVGFATMCNSDYRDAYVELTGRF